MLAHAAPASLGLTWREPDQRDSGGCGFFGEPICRISQHVVMLILPGAFRPIRSRPGRGTEFGLNCDHVRIARGPRAISALHILANLAERIVYSNMGRYLA
jgi:hypothetical protein